jgi:hypothetical protein
MPLWARVTTDHQVIRRWVQDRGGHPAAIRPGRGGEGRTALYIDFPHHPARKLLTRTSWEEFFARFDRERLAFLYQERTSTGLSSRLFRIVRREVAAGSHRQ